MKLSRIFFPLILFPFSVFSTDLKPWFPNDFEIQASATELLQYYPKIKAPHNYRYHTLDSFTTLSAELAMFQYCAEVETTVAHTKRQSFGWDNIRLTGRYQFTSDIAGDPFASAAGITLTQAFTNSLRDPSSFHHGTFEAELFFAIGKESACLDKWYKRFWGMIGIADGGHGWPWLHGHFEWEKNWLDVHQLKIFAETLWGFGSHNFHKPFRGYGKIRHQSVDLGIGYSYFFENDLKLSFDYSYRVYARNFPEEASRLKIEILYPFSCAACASIFLPTSLSMLGKQQ